MEHLIVFAIAALLGLCIGADLAVLHNDRQHALVNAEFETIVRDEMDRLRAELDIERTDPRVPQGGIGGVTRGQA